MEDSGYLTRIAVMLTWGMQTSGCTVRPSSPSSSATGATSRPVFPADHGIAQAETACGIPGHPHSLYHRTVVILGLVGKFVSIWWALALYAFDIVLIIIVGRIAFKVVPGESVGLIMEMPDYHVPSASVVVKQTWARTKSLIWFVFPAYIIGSAAIQVFYAVGLLTPVNNVLAPVTVFWLGLPIIVGITLIFGIVRKELTILTLAVLFGSTNFAAFLTPVELIVIALVSMLYIPCISVILGPRLGVRVETVACDLLYRDRPRSSDRRDRIQAAQPVYGMREPRGGSFSPLHDTSSEVPGNSRDAKYTGRQFLTRIRRDGGPPRMLPPLLGGEGVTHFSWRFGSVV